LPQPHDRILPGDEDPDAELLRKIEQHVLDSYPNPNRVGCFSPEELKEIVHHPERFDLADDEKYLHLFRCAECTRDVIALREGLERELVAGEANEQSAPSGSVRDNLKPPLQRTSGLSYPTLFATALASLCLGGFLVWLAMARTSTGVAVPPSPTAQVLDLAAFSSTRGGVNPPAGMVMIRQANSFLIELPVQSPAGTYHVAVVDSELKEKVSSNGTTRSLGGGQLELPVALNLTSLPPGQYRLAIQNQGQNQAEVHYYAATLR